MFVVVAALACAGAEGAEGKYEGRAIRSQHVEPATRGQGEAPQPSGEGEKPAAKYDVRQVAVGLAIVIGAILALRVFGKRVLSFPGANRLSQAVRVVMRTPVGPRQQLMLVQVGKRLVLVGNSGTQMSALCEIGDPDEVAALLGQAGAEKSDSRAAAFAGVFKREERKFDHPAEEDEQELPREADGLGLDPDGGVGREEIGELLERVRGMSKQFGSK
jgi:flagellar protein FliO/FliZ